MLFLIVFVQPQSYESFRLVELRELATLVGVDLKYDESTYDPGNPCFVVELPCAEDARKLARRAILIRCARH
jgi:hypothetical protein